MLVVVRYWKIVAVAVEGVVIVIETEVRVEGLKTSPKS